MGKIVAIGGGEIGRPRKEGGVYPVETLAIDREIIRLSGKKHPKLLLLPTASGDSEGYFEVVKRHFGKRLGCNCDVLYLVRSGLKTGEIRKRIMGSDIIYVGGGNTLNMLNVWKARGVDRILREAYRKGIVLAGVSAGAICWFRYGNSDSRPGIGRRNHGLVRVGCLNFVPLTLSPHHTRESHRKLGFANIMKRTTGVGVALQDCAALEIVDDTYRIISSNKTAHAHRVYAHKKGVRYDRIRAVGFRPLSELMII